MPLYPIVLTIRLGASSTVTGAISRLNTVPEISLAPEAAGVIGPGIAICCAASGETAAAAPASFRKSRRSMELGSGIGLGIETVSLGSSSRGAFVVRFRITKAATDHETGVSPVCDRPAVDGRHRTLRL